MSELPSSPIDFSHSRTVAFAEAFSLTPTPETFDTEYPDPIVPTVQSV